MWTIRLGLVELLGLQLDLDRGPGYFGSLGRSAFITHYIHPYLFRQMYLFRQVQLIQTDVSGSYMQTICIRLNLLCMFQDAKKHVTSFAMCQTSSRLLQILSIEGVPHVQANYDFLLYIFFLYYSIHLYTFFLSFISKTQNSYFQNGFKEKKFLFHHLFPHPFDQVTNTQIRFSICSSIFTSSLLFFSTFMCDFFPSQLLLKMKIVNNF